jgi:predicted phage-related endonuclease
MAVTGHTWAALGVLFQAREFYFCEVERHEEFIGQMILEESAFWDRILNQEPPPADASDATKDALKRLYPDDDGTSVTLGDGSYLALDEKRSELDEQIKAMQEEKQGLDNRLKAAIGEATEAHLTNGTIYTLKADKRGVRSLRRKEARQ